MHARIWIGFGLIAVLMTSCSNPRRQGGPIINKSGEVIVEFEETPYLGPRGLEILTADVIRKFKANTPTGLVKPRVCFYSIWNQTNEPLTTSLESVYQKADALLMDWGHPINRQYVVAGFRELGWTDPNKLFVPKNMRDFRTLMERETGSALDWLLWGNLTVIETHGGRAAKKYQLTLQAVNLKDGTTRTKDFAEIWKKY